MAATRLVLATAALVGAVVLLASCGSSAPHAGAAAGVAGAVGVTTTTAAPAGPAVVPTVPDGPQVSVPIAATGSVQVCETERQEIITAYQSSKLLSQTGGGDTAREYIVDPDGLTYFVVPTGATTGPILRKQASLRLVPDTAPCADIATTEVPVGSQ